MRMFNAWLTYWNECLRMIDETFIRHHLFNMLKQFRRTRLIETDATVHKRIHTNSTMMDDEHILTVTSFTQVLFASTCKLTSGVVRLCVKGALAQRIIYSLASFDVRGCMNSVCFKRTWIQLNNYNCMRFIVKYKCVHCHSSISIVQQENMFIWYFLVGE